MIRGEFHPLMQLNPNIKSNKENYDATAWENMQKFIKKKYCLFDKSLTMWKRQKPSEIAITAIEIAKIFGHEDIARCISAKEMISKTF